jgi:kinesin family member C2/C3
LATKEFVRSSLKLKENTVTSERTKQLPERTPPRPPRRLSLETTSSEKGSIPGKPPKSPVSAMRFNRDHGTARDKECSIDGFNRTKLHRSVIQVNLALNNFIMFGDVTTDLLSFFIVIKDVPNII